MWLNDSASDASSRGALGGHERRALAGREPAARLGDAPRPAARSGARAEARSRRERAAPIAAAMSRPCEVRPPGGGRRARGPQQHERPCRDRPRGVEPRPCRRPRSCRRCAPRAQARGRVRRQVLRRPAERRDDDALVLAREERPQRLESRRAAGARRARARASRSACCETSCRVSARPRGASARAPTHERRSPTASEDDERDRRRSCARRLRAATLHARDGLVARRRAPCGSSPAGRACGAATRRARRRCASRPVTSSPQTRSSSRSRESDDAAVLEQEREQVELLARQLDRLAGDGHLAGVAATTTSPSSSSLLVGAAARLRRSTAFTRASSSRGENGFVDVVVGAELEPARRGRAPRRARSASGSGRASARGCAGRPRSRPCPAARCRARRRRTAALVELASASSPVPRPDDPVARRARGRSGRATRCSPRPRRAGAAHPAWPQRSTPPAPSRSSPVRREPRWPARRRPGSPSRPCPSAERSRGQAARGR